MKLDTGEAGAAQRQAAAERAAALVSDGMILGFGSGRAATLVLEALARRAQQEPLRVRGVPSSERTAQAARSLGLELISLNEHPRLDLTIDGADEVDPRRRLIKGAGGALMREKVLAAAADRLVIVVEGAKLVPHLGATRGVPLEVLPFAHGACERRLQQLGGEPRLRRTADGGPAVTDNGNWVIDCAFPQNVLDDAERLEAGLHAIPGLLESGLFVAPLDPTVYAGTADGVRVLSR
ncbi:MAG TPA: ribose-5-phosphate isomerase RpiA [Chloroflexota bacterium]|nr:ribose-5-phosphate isomerase RpiA [Chloroflexota bacterium]